MEVVQVSAPSSGEHQTEQEHSGINFNLRTRIIYLFSMDQTVCTEHSHRKKSSVSIPGGVVVLDLFEDVGVTWVDFADNDKARDLCRDCS